MVKDESHATVSFGTVQITAKSPKVKALQIVVFHLLFTINAWYKADQCMYVWTKS